MRGAPRFAAFLSRPYGDERDQTERTVPDGNPPRQAARDDGERERCGEERQHGPAERRRQRAGEVALGTTGLVDRSRARRVRVETHEARSYGPPATPHRPPSGAARGIRLVDAACATSDDLVAQRPCRSGRARRHAELRADVRDVPVHGVRREQRAGRRSRRRSRRARRDAAPRARGR